MQLESKYEIYTDLPFIEGLWFLSPWSRKSCLGALVVPGDGDTDACTTFLHKTHLGFGCGCGLESLSFFFCWVWFLPSSFVGFDSSFGVCIVASSWTNVPWPAISMIHRNGRVKSKLLLLSAIVEVDLFRPHIMQAFMVLREGLLRMRGVSSSSPMSSTIKSTGTYSSRSFMRISLASPSRKGRIWLIGQLQMNMSCEQWAI